MGLKPGYKRTEVGIIPNDWASSTLGHLTVLMTNGFVGTATTHYVSNNDGVLYIQGYNVIENSFNFHGIKYIAEEFHKGHMKSCLRSGDLLTVQTGDVGLTTIVPKALAGSNCHALIISRFDLKQVSSAFISYYLNSKQGRSRLKLIETGTAMKHLNVGDVLRFAIPLPSLPEQRAIASALSDTDALLSSLDRLLAKKRDIKQAVMQQLLTGKQRLPGFSGEWEVKQLGEVSRIGMGRTPSRRMQVFWGKGYPWLSIADLKTKYVFETKEEITPLAASSMTVIPKGTLIMSFKLSIGRMAFTGRDMYSNEAICCFGDLRMNAHFLYYVLGRTDFSLYGKQAVKGFTLNSESLKIIEVVFPSQDEQTAIAAVLSDMDAEIDALQQRRDKTRAIKQGMMQELLTGRTRLA